MSGRYRARLNELFPEQRSGVLGYNLAQKMTEQPANSSQIPTRFGAAVFHGKAILLQARRGLINTLDRDIRVHPKTAELIDAPIVASSVSRLWTETDARERHLIAGKIQNLRVAIKCLSGTEVAAGETFSFWKQIGRASTRRGFARGREVREGCLIPSVGGGLCQLSNALYDAALQAGFEIVERHAHSRVIPGSLAEVGRDATVFWNYIDLRFRSSEPFRIEARMDAERLAVHIRSKAKNKKLYSIGSRRQESAAPNSCATCGVESCHRSIHLPETTQFGRSAYLVDDVWPEFQKLISQGRQSNDRLFIPLNGHVFRKANYRWDTSGFGKIFTSTPTTLIRSYRSRSLASQGAARQENLLAMQKELAASYARRLTPEDLHLVIQQELLKYLWLDGHLAGRTYDVLMTSLPIALLQRRLDIAAELHPESKTLDDFRADPELAAVESEALEQARKLYTPHANIASIAPEKSVLLDWTIPNVSKRERPKNKRPNVVFPATTVGRKGCYELREALKGIDAELVILGPQIEDKDFWAGFDVVHGNADWLRTADVVVLPAFVEHKPRRLLQALAHGIPVIATKECGVGNLAGTVTVPSGNADALRHSLLDSIEGGVRCSIEMSAVERSETPALA